MSKKNELMNTILYSMMDKVDKDQLDKLKHCLQVSFYNYTINKIETTEVSCGSEEVTEELLKYFAICKLGAGRSKTTVKQYLLVARQLCSFVDNKPLNMITTDDIQYFLAVYKEKHHVSGCTMDSKRRYLSSIFTLLKKHKKIDNNPIEMVEGIKYLKKCKQPLSSEEIRSVKDAVSNKNNNILRTRNTMIINLLLDTGCRVSELTNISIKDFDFQRNIIKILGKGNKERFVLFSESTKEDIMKYLATRNYCEADPLLMDLSGTSRLKSSGVQSMLKNLRKKCGIQRLHAHLFRATMATDLVQKHKVSIDVVAKYLGHSGLGTIQKYVINSQEHIRNEMKKVGLG
jgi:site-specific recombinase XerD